jgi:hypothetical protein
VPPLLTQSPPFAKLETLTAERPRLPLGRWPHRKMVLAYPRSFGRKS